MVLSVGLKLTKLVLVILISFLLLCGIALAIIGIVIHRKVDTVNELFKNGEILITEATVIVILGCTVAAVAFFGLFGTVKQSPQLMFTYAFLLIVLILAKTAAATQMLINIENNSKRYASFLNRAFQKQLSNPTSVDPRIDRVQSTFHCCGRNSFRDWQDAVPRSCCGEQSSVDCKIIGEGCQIVVERFLADAQKALGGVLLVITLFEVITLGLNCCLASGIRDQLELLQR
ncbi:23 kDa integral membrane protein-like [Wyeomyia smithii]|uniref:23 kDa integral membrane protein-like n=1 Tax=Wyeomyia smithii TaxID=174621 RepID=UPI002468135B|nr:23 kDa integral membrane protein-like [Wyeomyia smithii]